MHEDRTMQRASRTLIKIVGAGTALTLALAPGALASSGNGQTPPGQAKKEAAPAPPAHAPAHGVRGTSPQTAPKAKKAKPAPAPKRAAPAARPAAPKQAAPAAPKQAKPQSKQRSAPSRGNSAIAHERVTFCHATGSATNPFVEITTSRSAVINAHDHHQDGRDIIPVPAGGCPTPDSPVAAASLPGGGALAPVQPVTPGAPAVERVSEVLSLASTAAPSPTPTSAGEQGVLGATASSPEVAGETDEVAPRGTVATLSRDGGLPFTGLELLVVVAAGLAALLGGFALHRASAARA